MRLLEIVAEQTLKILVVHYTMKGATGAQHLANISLDAAQNRLGLGRLLCWLIY